MSNGYNAFLDVIPLGKNITRSGLLGYISKFSVDSRVVLI